MECAQIFHEYEPLVGTLNKTSLRSEVLPVEQAGDDDDEVVLEFAQIGTICAIPADANSSETVNVNNTKDETFTDDWGQKIAPGQAFLEGRYFLHQYSGRYESTYTFDKRNMFFFKESIVYPYVQYMPADKGGDYCY